MGVIARNTSQGVMYVDEATGQQISLDEVNQRIEANKNGTILGAIGNLFAGKPTPATQPTETSSEQNAAGNVPVMYRANAERDTNTDKASTLNEATKTLGLDDEQGRAVMQGAMQNDDLAKQLQNAAKAKQNSPEDWEQFAEDNPATIKYLSDQKNMAQSHDDIKNLGFIERTITSIKDHLEMAELEEQRAALGRRYMQQGIGYKELTADQLVELQALNDKRQAMAKKYDDPNSHWYNPLTWDFANVVGGVAGMAGDMQTALETGLAGAATGAAAGAAFGGIGAIPGALSGFGWGMRIGMGASMATRAVGNQYLNLITDKSASGEYMSPELAMAGAALDGVANGVIGAGGLGRLFARTPGAGEIYKAFSGAVPEAVLHNPEAEQAAWKVFAKNFTLNVAEQSLIFGSGTKAVEIASQRAAESLSGLTFDHSMEPSAAMQILEAGAEFVPTAVTMAGVSSVVGRGLSSIADRRNANNPAPRTTTEQALTAIDQAVTSSRTARRSPSAMETMVDGVVEGSSIEEVGIPAERFVAYFQKADPENPNRAVEEANKLGVSEEELQTALQAGDDITVKTGKFIAQYAGKEELKGLARDVRLGEGKHTDNEIQEAIDEFKALQADLKTLSKGEGIDKEHPAYQKAMGMARAAYPDGNDRAVEYQANIVYSLFKRAEDRGILQVIGYKNMEEAMDALTVQRKEQFEGNSAGDAMAQAWDSENHNSYYQKKENPEGSTLNNYEDQQRKAAQLKILQKNNPMDDNIRTGVRTVRDIKTAKEAFAGDESFSYPDFTEDMGKKALADGEITVYSSKPIKQGVFVSPSKMAAKDYADNGRVYSKKVSIKDIAWINGDKGQYAKSEMIGAEKLRMDNEKWEKSVDTYLENPRKSGQPLQIMTTPLVYELVDKSYIDISAGFPIKIAPSIMHKVLIKTEAQGGHADKISPDSFKNLPALLADPVMIMKNRTPEGEIVPGELLIIVEARDRVGAIINVPIVFTKERTFYSVKSFFGRNSDISIEKRMFEGDVFYINKPKAIEWQKKMEERKRTTERQYSGRQQSPMALSISGSFRNIPNEKDLVNIKLKNPYLYQSAEAATSTAVITESIPEIKPLMADGDNRILGSYTPIKDGKAIIEVYKNANMSTLPHEVMHHFVNLYDAAIRSGKASEELKRDFDILNKFVGAEEGTSAKDWTVEQHEKVTSAFESYFSEGKAPSLELTGVFSKMAKWMKKIYESMTRRNMPINDEVRGVFDRMLASDKQIEQAELFYNSERLFGGKELGLKEMKEYVNLLVSSHDEATAQMRAAIMKELTPAFKKALRDATKKAEADTTAEMHQEPLYAALLLLGTKETKGKIPADVLGADIVKEMGGGLKLNRALAEQTYGKEAVTRMPQSWFTKKGSFTLDDIADIVGLNSGDELRQMVMNNRNYAAEYKARVKAKVDAWREQELGPIQDKAVELIANGRSLEAIGIEAEVLTRKATEMKSKNEQETANLMAEGRKEAEQKREQQEKLDTAVENAKEKQEVTTRKNSAAAMRGKLKAKAARIVAKEAISAQRVADAGSWKKMLAQSTKAGRQATAALAKGDYEGARTFKDQELLQRAMAMEAMKAEKEIQKGLAFFKQIDKRGNKMKGIPHDYNVQIDNLLAKYDLIRREPITPVDGSQPPTLQEFMDGLQGQYLTPVVPDTILNGGAMHYTRLTMREFRDLKDAVRSLQQVGRNIDRALADNEKLTIADRRKAVIDKIKTHTERYTNQSEMGTESVTMRERLNRLVDVPIGLGLIKAETLLRIIDHGEEQGPAVRYILNPIIRGLDNANARGLKAVNDINKILKDVGWDRKSIQAMKKEIHHFDFLPNDITMEEIVMAAMNWGNEGNRDRLRYYFKSRSERATRLDDTAIQEIDQRVNRMFEVMDEKHWKLVQAVWDYLATYAPEIRQHEIDCSGLDPKMVDPIEFQVTTRDGKLMSLKGGYYPIGYDPNKSIVTMNQNEANALFQHNPTAHAMTDHGHTESRAKSVNRPLLLDWSVFTNHIQNVIYDLSMRKPIIDVNKIINSEEFTSEIDSRFGIATNKMLQRWLQDIAADQRDNLTSAQRVIKELRTRMSVGMLGFRAVALAIDLPQNVITSIWQAGAKETIKGMQEFYLGNPKEKMDFVNARSPMMAERSTFMDQNMADFRNSMFDQKTVLGIDKTKLAKTAFCCDMVADMAVMYPLWLRTYGKAIAEGKTEAEAITGADAMIRRTSMDNSKAGLAEIQRGSEGNKLLLPFYSFFNAMFNRVWFDAKLAQTFSEDGRPMDAAKLFTRMVVLGVMMPAMYEGIMKYELSNDRRKGKKKEEERARSAFVAGLTMPLHMLPFVGTGIDITAAGLAGTGSGNGFALSPVESSLTKAFSVPTRWYKFLTDKGGDPDAFRKAALSTADTVAMFSGVPTKINTLAINAWDAINKGDIKLADLISRRQYK